MSWSIQKDCPTCIGKFGFKLLDKHGVELYVRGISRVDNSGYIDVDAIVEKILFNTDSTDGTNLLIQVTSTIDHIGDITLAGRTQQYKCANCHKDSDSFLLNRLCLDKDMNGPRNGDAQCVTGCEFNRVSEPSDVFVLPVPNSYMSWQIVPDRTIVKFDYHVDDVRLIDNEPDNVGTQTVTNTCSELSICHDQSSIVSATETKTTTSSFSFTSGLSTSTSLAFEAGLPKLIPLTLSAKTTVTISTSSSQTTGGTTSSTKTWTESSSCVAKPGTVVKCDYMVKKTTIDVPWTITWNTGELTHGMYRGVDFIDLDLVTNTYSL